MKTTVTAGKVSKYGVISGPYFPVFGLNTEIYSVLKFMQCFIRSLASTSGVSTYQLAL